MALMSLKQATKKNRQLLQRQGMPGYLYRAKPFAIEKTVRTFAVERSHAAPVSINKRSQMDHYRAIVRADEPYIACISSDPNELRAKQVAAYAMLQWTRQRRRIGSTARWHTITGGLGDPLRDAEDAASRRRPDALVLTNVDASATSLKREKLRDLLELHGDVPRLVTTTGSDPVTFMNSLGVHCHHAVWIRSAETWELSDD